MRQGVRVVDTFTIQGRGRVVAGHLEGGLVVRIGDVLTDGSVEIAIRGVELLQTTPRRTHPTIGLLVSLPESYEPASGSFLTKPAGA